MSDVSLNDFTENYPRHKWDKSGERCLICGDKDWMGTKCKPLMKKENTRKEKDGE